MDASSSGVTISAGMARTRSRPSGWSGPSSIWACSTSYRSGTTSSWRSRESGASACWGTFLPRRVLRREEQVLADRTAEILDFLGLGAKAGEQVANLSWGDQKLVCIGRLLATDGEFLLMDEPAAGLSDEQIVELKALLRALVARGKTVLIIDHNMEAIMDLSEWVIVLNSGRILATGRPIDIQANDDVIKAYLGV